MNSDILRKLEQNHTGDGIQGGGNTETYTKIAKAFGRSLAWDATYAENHLGMSGDEWNYALLRLAPNISERVFALINKLYEREDNDETEMN